jgi:DNA-binding response OmpR family regulator
MNIPKRILIVDDEPNVRLMLRTTLESVGYAVTEAEDGLVALAHLAKHPCDAVLLDLQMTKLNGMETLRRLRETRNPVPVLFLTAHGSVPEAVAAMKLGAIDFLTKPITPDALRAVVADVLRRQELPANPPAQADFKAQPPVPGPSATSTSIAADSLALSRAKRAINQGEFAEAESILKDLALRDPRSPQVTELLTRLEMLKAQEGPVSFRILRHWFPTGANHNAV